MMRREWLPVNSKNEKSAPLSSADLPVIKRASIDAQPLYQVVKRQITDAIMFGKWPAGTVLPNEVALARMFGVAVGTLRRALLDLTKEGMLSRQRKTGTVVTGRTPQHSLRFFFQYFRLHGRDGSLQHSRTKVLGLECGKADAPERSALNLAAETQVLRLKRLRYVDGVPVMRDHFTLPADRVPDFPERIEDVPELLYLYLLDRYGIRISAVREQIGAELADKGDTELLDLAPKAAILNIEEVAYDQAGVPTIYAFHRCTTTNHRYVNEVQ
jgi:GntR family transcriptional regulator